jgi:putative ABC transport system substrate-binding protein
MTNRRFFISGFAVGVLGFVCVGSAQPARTAYRIGIVGQSPTSDLVGSEPRAATMRAFLDGLRKLGYVYGEHFVTEVRGSGGDPEQFRPLAAELVAARVDVIVATGPAVPAVKQATSTIPIIMSAATDPESEGFVQSLGRPGGNITGLSLQSIDTTGKRLELIKELVPGNAPVAVIWNALAVQGWQAAETAARQQGWQLLSLEIQEFNDIDRAFKRAADARAGAVLVYAWGIAFSHRKSLAELAAKSRLPAIYELRPYVEAGGLISYGPEINDIWRRAAIYVDKILKGAKPGELPVEQPTKFEVVINLKTAKALGITIPQSILLRADEVVQ